MSGKNILSGVAPESKNMIFHRRNQSSNPTKIQFPCLWAYFSTSDINSTHPFPGNGEFLSKEMWTTGLIYLWVFRLCLRARFIRQFLVLPILIQSFPFSTNSYSWICFHSFMSLWRCLCSSAPRMPQAASCSLTLCVFPVYLRSFFLMSPTSVTYFVLSRLGSNAVMSAYAMNVADLQFSYYFA